MPAEDFDYSTQILGRSTFVINAASQSASFQHDGKNSIIYQSGEIVGDSYRLLDQLGRGGMGVVYLAEHLVINQRYALKLLAPDQVNEKNWQRFEIEGRALAKLNHENIVKIFNMGIDKKGCPFYVMELLPGCSLMDIIDESVEIKLTQKQILKAYSRACAGLGLAHKKGIVHRDVKPSNILLSGPIENSDSIKIVDFGIASLSAGSGEKQNLTAVGEVFGSPLYMSPEQCLGAKVDARSDIYSLGCSLYHSLTGRPPLVGPTALATVTMHHSTQAPTLEEKAEDQEFSGALEDLVAKLLEKDPDQRYQTMEEVEEDLERLSQGKTIAPSVSNANYRAARGEVDHDEFNDSDEGEGEGEDEGDDHEQASAISKKPRWLLVSGLTLTFGIVLSGIVFAAIFAPQVFDNNKSDRADSAKLNAEAALLAQNHRIGKAQEEDTSGILNSEETDFAARKELMEAAKIPPRTVRDKSGKLMREIVFPKVACAESSKNDRRTFLHETVYFPIDEKLNILFTSETENYPAFLKNLANEKIETCHLKQFDKGINEAIDSMRNWRYLKSLVLAESSLEKFDFAKLDTLPKVDRLSLKTCVFDSKKLAQWPGLERITVLFIAHGRHIDPIAKRARTLTKLHTLSLSTPELSSTAAKDLGQCSQLSGLVVHAKSLSDADVAELCKNKGLRLLGIEGKKLTSKCIDRIVTLPLLQELQIARSEPLAASDLAKIKKHLPRCNVRYTLTDHQDEYN